MKHIATVPAALIRAAQVFQAKQDVRFYLNGICIEKDHVISTDGHSMFVSPYESDLRPDDTIIVYIHGAIPARAGELRFFVEEGEEQKRGIIEVMEAGTLPLFDSHGFPRRMFFNLVTGRFPDWRRVMPSGDPVPMNKIGLNFELVGRIEKASKALGPHSKTAAVALLLHGPRNEDETEGPVIAELKNNVAHPDAKIIIMPMRIS